MFEPKLKRIMFSSLKSNKWFFWSEYKKQSFYKCVVTGIFNFFNLFDYDFILVHFN